MDDPVAVTNTTRVFFVFEDGKRLALDVDDQRLVGDVMENVRRTLRLDEDEKTSGSQSGQLKTLFLSFAGAILDVSWRFADIGIPFGAQVYCLSWHRGRNGQISGWATDAVQKTFCYRT